MSTGRLSASQSTADVILGQFITVTVIFAWITSVINCIMNDKWALLIIDIIFMPIAVIHGIFVWIEYLVGVG